MIADQGKFRWRVRAADGKARASAFDALVLPIEEGGRVRADFSTRLTDAAVPYFGELDDTALTLIVRARESIGSLIVECEFFGPDGARKGYARTSQPVSIIVRSTTGVFVTGLPGSAPSTTAT